MSLGQQYFPVVFSLLCACFALALAGLLPVWTGNVLFRLVHEHSSISWWFTTRMHLPDAFKAFSYRGPALARRKGGRPRSPVGGSPR
jgi:hypothetical protein